VGHLGLSKQEIAVIESTLSATFQKTCKLSNHCKSKPSITSTSAPDNYCKVRSLVLWPLFSLRKASSNWFSLPARKL